MAPVYTSDPALPRRPQDSAPACLLALAGWDLHLAPTSNPQLGMTYSPGVV